MTLAVRESLGDTWLDLWFEPWRGAHSSWTDASLAPPQWQWVAEGTPLGMRLAYHHWCRHFSLDAESPPQACPASLRDLPSMVPALEQAILYLGMVILARQSNFSATWIASRDDLVRCAPMALWKHAIAQARSCSPLSPEGAARVTHVERGHLQLAGMALLYSLIGTHCAPLWSRLRFRFEADSVLRCESSRAPMTMEAKVENAEWRHAIRAWHASWLLCNSRTSVHESIEVISGAGR